MATADVIIAGGGLAGLSAGIGLANKGHHVLIIEKHGYPRHKVCGEYLSREALPFLDSLGVRLPSGLPEISKLNLYMHDGNAIGAKLPLGGIGISRFTLDHLLYKRAIDAGCEFIFDEVLQFRHTDDVATVRTKSGKEYHSRLVLGSYGRHALKKEVRPVKKASRWIGIKAHYRVGIDPKSVGLYLFDGGYCGVSRVEDGVTNICYLASYDAFAHCKSPEAFTREVVAKNTALAQLLNRAEPLFGQPLVVSNITFEAKPRVDNHMLLLGDAAQMIHPLSGNGMAMAIGSAGLAIPLASEFLLGKINRHLLEIGYARAWNSRFSYRVRAGRRIAGLMMDRRWSKAGWRMLRMFPGLLPRIVATTHAKVSPDFSRRSQAPEIMDDFDLKGAELRDALDKLAGINRFLGGNRLTLQGIGILARQNDRPLKIVDFGCGDGDMLRQVAKWGRKKNVTLELVGVDANAFTISVAREKSALFPEITYECRDFLQEGNRFDCDIALFTLTLHHFKDDDLVPILEKSIRGARLGIVVNDLHRSPVAYRLFKVVCAIFRLNKMSREDGLVSILRGFSRKELEGYAKKLNVKPQIAWKWAFRFRWIISKT